MQYFDLIRLLNHIFILKLKSIDTLRCRFYVFHKQFCYKLKLFSQSSKAGHLGHLNLEPMLTVYLIVKPLVQEAHGIIIIQDAAICEQKARTGRVNNNLIHNEVP